MSAPSYSQSSGWTVTGSRPSQQVNAQNQIIDGYYVDYVTGNGVAGSVFVAQRDYTPDKVRALIAEQTATHDAVIGLSESPH